MEHPTSRVELLFSFFGILVYYLYKLSVNNYIHLFIIGSLIGIIIIWGLVELFGIKITKGAIFRIVKLHIKALAQKQI